MQNKFFNSTTKHSFHVSLFLRYDTVCFGRLVPTSYRHIMHVPSVVWWKNKALQPHKPPVFFLCICHPIRETFRLLMGKQVTVTHQQPDICRPRRMPVGFYGKFDSEVSYTHIHGLWGANKLRNVTFRFSPWSHLCLIDCYSVQVAYMITNVSAGPSAFIFMRQRVLKLKQQGSSETSVPVTKLLNIKSQKTRSPCDARIWYTQQNVSRGAEEGNEKTLFWLTGET